MCPLTNYSSDIVDIDVEPSDFRNSFFDVVNLFRLTASAAIVNRYRQRDTRLAAEAQNVIAAHGASTSYAEHKMRIRLTILLELETILCTEYRYVRSFTVAAISQHLLCRRNSYFTAINLIGASVFNHVGDHHRQRDGVIEAEVARVNDMIERIRYAVD